MNKQTLSVDASYSSKNKIMEYRGESIFMKFFLLEQVIWVNF